MKVRKMYKHRWLYHIVLDTTLPTQQTILYDYNYTINIYYFSFIVLCVGEIKD